MFTFEKPDGVNFTLLMPDWPYYFLIMLLIGLGAYTVMMLVGIFLNYKINTLITLNKDCLKYNLRLISNIIFNNEEAI